jgi:hypothetical protein
MSWTGKSELLKGELRVVAAVVSQVFTSLTSSLEFHYSCLNKVGCLCFLGHILPAFLNIAQDKNKNCR